MDRRALRGPTSGLTLGSTGYGAPPSPAEGEPAGGAAVRFAWPAATVVPVAAATRARTRTAQRGAEGFVPASVRVGRSDLPVVGSAAAWGGRYGAAPSMH